MEHEFQVRRHIAPALEQAQAGKRLRLHGVCLQAVLRLMLMLMGALLGLLLSFTLVLVLELLAIILGCIALMFLELSQPVQARELPELSQHPEAQLVCLGLA